MGYYTSAYVMYGAEVATERAYRTAEWLENPAANAILHKWDVGYAQAGPYDNDFLFLCKHFQEAEMGEYKVLKHPDSQTEAEDRLAILAAAQELGLSLVKQPEWLVVPDVS
jgi:hypothetical protein